MQPLFAFKRAQLSKEMKASHRFIALIILITLGVPVYSQTAAEENGILQQITVMEKALLLPKQFDATLQQGVNNLVFLEQASAMQTTTIQSGWFNLILLQQSISGGSIKVMQTGQSNEYRGEIAGNEVDLLIIQQGGFNAIDQSIAGERVEFTITQEGNRNTIQHRADRFSVPLQIYQTGSDMRLIIKSGY